MKKITFLIAVISLFAFSCKKEDKDTQIVITVKKDGVVIANATAYVEAVDTSFTSSKLSNSSGIAEFSGLEANTYNIGAYIEISGDMYYDYDMVTLANEETKNITLDLEL